MTETMEVMLDGARFRIEKRRSGWHLMEQWDDTRRPAWGNKPFGWVLLLPIHQLKVDLILPLNQGGK